MVLPSWYIIKKDLTKSFSPFGFFNVHLVMTTKFNDETKLKMITFSNDYVLLNNAIIILMLKSYFIMFAARFKFYKLQTFLIKTVHGCSILIKVILSLHIFATAKKA